jgi:hypothetical protein
MKELQSLVNADSVFVENFDSIYFHPGIVNLIKQKAYKEALLKLSESDSIQLVINLSDSTINLIIKGVIIHQTKIVEYTKDKFLRKLPLIQEVKFFSQPLLVQSHFATIVKEPVVVRHAPKDTTEAALNAWQPDTLIQNPAFVAFTTEEKIRIFFEQNENKSFSDKLKKIGFYNHFFAKKVITSQKNFFGFKKQEYIPNIIVKIPVDDLRAIYRALPNNTYIVVKM